MEKFNGKIVPQIEDPVPPTQQDCCEMNPCETSQEVQFYDCGDCLFDEKRCPRLIFEEWKQERKRKNDR
jgi:hypothetical protein